MTTYILHGGETSVPNEHNKKFYQEWVKDFDREKVPTILLVYFARPEDSWDALAQSDQERFCEYTNDRAAQFIIAQKDKGAFLEQIKHADVVYFRGGKPEMIVEILGDTKDNLLDLLEGKTYVGSSAGVMFLCDYARSKKRGWEKHLGLLPFNAIVHHSEDMRDDLNRFRDDYPENDKEYLLLAETQYVVKNF